MTQDEQKEREAFEMYAGKQIDPLAFRIASNGKYVYSGVQAGWESWQARGEYERTKPVSLGACADAMERAFEDMGFDPPEKSKVVWHKNVTAMATKAVLDAAGVTYVD